MEKKKSYKLIIGVCIIVVWILVLTGILRVPAFIWLFLIIISIIFYLTFTKTSLTRSKSLNNVIEDMDDYMERKAEEKLGSDKEEKDSEEDEYDFDDDIEIIKK